MSITRLFYLSVFIGCLALLGFGLYLEHVKGLEPCPLCILQRIAYIAVTVVALVAAIHNPEKLMRYFYGVLMLISTGSGAIIAGRQTWLQHLPADQVPECGPGFDYMLEVFPLADALRMVFSGSGECAEVQWVLLGLSIAEWSLLCFSLIILGTILVAFFMKPKERKLFSEPS